MPARPLLFVDHARALGGAEHFLLDTLALVDRARFVPHLAAPEGALADAAESAGATVHRQRLDRLRRDPAAPWRLARTTRALVALIRGRRIAVVCSNTMRASVYSALAAAAARRPHVWRVHDIVEPGPYARLLCRLSSAVIAVSGAAAAPLPCRHKIEVIGNGVRLDAFGERHARRAAELRASWLVPQDGVLVAQVARLAPWKGQADVIAAASRVLEQCREAYFAVVGGDIFADNPAYEQRLRYLARAAGLSGRMVFPGQVDEVPAVLQAADIVVHASAGEPFGRILVEAGAAARPVVAYASGAVPEIIVDGQTGVLIPPGDAGALAAALTTLIDDPARRRELGGRARVHVARCFDAAGVTRRIEAVLARVSPDH